MVTIWKVVYWSTFLLAWLVLPVLYEAWYAGDFTWRDRIVSALKVNLISYLLIVVLGVIFSAYVMVSAEMSFGALAEFLMWGGNTYGLLLVIALLGNGLVEVPRAIWRYRDTGKELQRLQIRAILLDTEVYDSTIELGEAETAVHKMSRRVFAKPSDFAALRPHMDRINEACDALVTSDGASAPLTALPGVGRGAIVAGPARVRAKCVEAASGATKERKTITTNHLLRRCQK